jgi:hypothetical protein
MQSVVHFTFVLIYFPSKLNFKRRNESCTALYQKCWENYVKILLFIYVVKVVAGQSATIRFGRGRRPRGPTYARGTIRSLFEDQEQATQRTAYDVATRPPCRNLFWGRSFRNNSVCLCRQSIHFEFIGSGFIFVYRITFSFISVSLSVSLSVFVCFFRGFFRVFIVESLCQPVLGRLESHMLAPKF